MSVVNVNARASSSAARCAGRCRRRRPRAPATTSPWARLSVSVRHPNSGSRGSRGGRRMTSASSGSASNTTEQAGSMISSRKTMCTGSSTSGQPEEHRQQRHPGDRHVDGEDVGHRLLQVVEDAPAQPHGPHDRREVVVEQHERRRLARDVGAAPAHRDADVRRLERRRVVHAVAGHRDDLAVRLERLDEPQLLLGHDAREDAGRRSTRSCSAASSMRVELGAGDDLLARRGRSAGAMLRAVPG